MFLKTHICGAVVKLVSYSTTVLLSKANSFIFLLTVGKLVFFVLGRLQNTHSRNTY